MQKLIEMSAYCEQVASLLREISAPARIKILLLIGRDEVCVCHLEANLAMKQAYLSQHLMALRKAGILIATRDGRFMHYRLANTEILDIINNVARILNLEAQQGETGFIHQDCSCPQCKEKK